MNDVVAYKTVVIIRGIIRSFLSLIVQEVIIFLLNSNGKTDSGNNTLFITTIKNNNFFNSKGRYPKSVGADKIIASP